MVITSNELDLVKRKPEVFTEVMRERVSSLNKKDSIFLSCFYSYGQGLQSMVYSKHMPKCYPGCPRNAVNPKTGTNSHLA
jgi:hypothetical protein